MDYPTFFNNKTELQPLLYKLNHLTYGLMALLTQKDFEEDTQSWATHLKLGSQAGAFGYRQTPYELLDKPKNSGEKDPQGEFANLKDNLNYPLRPSRSKQYGPFTYDFESMPEDEDLNPNHNGCSSNAREIPNYIVYIDSDTEQNKKNRLKEYITSLT